jgi:NADPH-dependent ferric siderophore reductase
MSAWTNVVFPSRASSASPWASTTGSLPDAGPRGEMAYDAAQKRAVLAGDAASLPGD